VESQNNRCNHIIIGVIQLIILAVQVAAAALPEVVAVAEVALRAFRHNR